MNHVRNFLVKLFGKIKLNPLILLVVIALIIRFEYAISLFMTNGSFAKTNDSYWYVEHAYELINDFKIDLDFNGIFYISYYSIVALLLLIFKTDISMVILQVLLGALTVIPLYKTCETLLNKPTAIIASLIYISSRELKYWSTFILTDSIFISNLVFLIFSYTFYCKNRNRKYLILTVCNIIYMVFLRPAGTITVCFLFLYIIVKNIVIINRLIMKNKLMFAILLFGCIPYILFATYFVLKSSVGLSFYFNLKWLIYQNYGAGQIFDIPTLYDHKYAPIIENKYFNNFVLSFFINNYYHIIIIYIKRFILLWGEGWIWCYKFTSISQAIDYFRRCLPLALALFGMLRVILKRKSTLSLVLFVPIISTVVFCVIFFLDSAWRYRLPSLPFMAIFIGFGIDYFITLIINNKLLKTNLDKIIGYGKNFIKA